MTTPKATTPETEANAWHLLSPLGVIYFIMKFITSFLKQGAQGFLPLIVVFFSAGDDKWFAVMLVAVAAVALLILGSMLSYLMFKFKITDDSFLIKSGVFKKKSLTLNFGRIQNVALSEPIYFRPFGLVVMSLESAGSSSEEVSLGGIPRSLAESFRATILSHKPKKATSEQADSPADGEPYEEIVHQPISELVRYGLTNNSIWVFAGIASGAMAQVEWDDYQVYSFAKGAVLDFIGTSPLTITLFAIGSIIALVMLLMSLSIIGTIIVNYDYHLTRHLGRFHRKKGLFEREETSLLESKIQSIVLRHPWPAILLKRVNIELKQVGFGGKANQPQEGAAKKFIIPSVTEAFSHRFTQMLYPAFDSAAIKLKPVDKLYTRKIILWKILPICLLPTIGLIVATQHVIGLVPLLIPILAIPIVMLKRSRYGYASDGEMGVVKSGFVGHRISIFPLHKVQSVSIEQSPGQRRANLADLHINLAGTSLTIPYIAMQDANAWRDQILYKIETSKRPWM